MPLRKVALANGQYYHIYSKSIAGFKIFNSPPDFARIRELLAYYNVVSSPGRYSLYKENPDARIFRLRGTSLPLVRIIAYCFMPTHIHLLLLQLADKGIERVMQAALNSYTRYLNIKLDRLGPLWAGRFKNVCVDKESYLLHLTRYIHLNPVRAGLVATPDAWPASSYNEFIAEKPAADALCDFRSILSMDHQQYRKFVEDYVSYQESLTNIESLLIDND